MTKNARCLFVCVLAAVLSSPAATVRPVATDEALPHDGRWMAVPMADARLKAAGYAGGEGCQWVNCVAVGGKDGRLVVMGNDTGGVYRSCDAGLSWEPATVGYGSCGAVAMAIDPDSPERVLAVGSSGKNSGLFLSEDGAASWRQVLCVPLKRSHDYRTQLAFDRKSHMAYWASRDLGLYRSQDGGLSWQRVDGGAVAAGSEFAVSGDGCLLAGTKDGLFASGDCGASWRKVLDVGINGICAPGGSE